MVSLCWAAKGGSGTTVITSALALESTRPALLVDLAGDVPLAIGLDEPDRPGALDWLAATGPAAQLDDLTTDIDDLTTFLPMGHGLDAAPFGRWHELAVWLAEWEHNRHGEVWIDAGTGAPNEALAAAVDDRWLVTRACYLALQRAARSDVRPTGVVLVQEPGRTLATRDIERSVGVPVVMCTDIDPSVARSVDSGLLVSRVPRSFRRQLRRGRPAVPVAA